MSVPFYGTINEDQNPRDDMWFTASFGSTWRETMTFCEGMKLEEGEIELVFFGRPGVGYNDLLTAIEADMVVLMAQKDPNGRLVLTEQSAPFEYSGGSANEEYSLSVFVDYQFYS